MGQDHLHSYELIGDPDENFYQLGIKDRHHYHLNYDHMEKVSKIQSLPLLGQVLSKGFDYYVNKSLDQFSEEKKYLMSYADGLKTSLTKVGRFLISPDFLAAFNHFLPTRPKTLFGCSSFIGLNHKNECVHGRIFDYPLINTFEKYQRILKVQFPGHPQVWGLSSAGIPYPATSLMNDSSVTLTPHQLSGNSFDYEGKPLYFLIKDLINNSHNKHSFIKNIKKCRSMTAWAMYVTFSSEEFLGVQIEGKNLTIKEFYLKDKKLFYFSNLPLKKLSQEEKEPIYLKNYCQMRQDMALQSIDDYYQKHDSFKDLDLLKLMSKFTPKKKIPSKKWKLGPVTPITLHIITLNAAAGKAHLIRNKPPHFFKNEYTSVKDIWKRPISTEYKKNARIDQNYLLGHEHLSAFIKDCDYDKTHSKFHHLQMAISYFKNYPEQKIIHFFALIYEYLNAHNKKNIPSILENLTKLLPDLPLYLQDHAYIFLARIERRLYGHTHFNEKVLSTERMKQIFSLEQKVPRSFLFLLNHSTHPRLEIFDIIYTHYKLH